MQIDNLCSLIFIGLQDLTSREKKINQKMEETFNLITGMIVDLISINIIIRLLELTYLIYQKFDYFFKSFPAGMHEDCHPRRVLFFYGKSVNLKEISDEFDVIFTVFDCLEHRMVIAIFFTGIIFFCLICCITLFYLKIIFDVNFWCLSST